MLKTRMLYISICACIFILNADAQIDSTTIYSISVEATNVSGGGFQSDVTISDDGTVVYSCGDVSGISKSTDGGLLYTTINEGLKSPKVASLAITPDNPEILYAGTGDKGGSGGLFRSIDGGETWSLTAAGDSGQFAGNHSDSNDPLPTGHPRSNGDLVVVDTGNDPGTYTDDLVIAGTYKDGVKVYSEGGDIELYDFNSSGYVRSVARHDSVPGIVYAAIYFGDSSQNGIYEINYSNPDSTFSTLRYPTPNPEGITVLSSGRVYAAIGKGGIVKYNGSTWDLKNASLDINNILRQWTAVTGYLKGSSDVIYAGVNNLGGNANGSDYSSIWRSVNGGDSWTPLVAANTNVSDTIYGTSNPWWYRIDAFPQAGLGRTNNVVSSIDVSRGTFPNVVADDIIYVSGRGGIWKSDTGGSLWRPAVNNMQVTANNGVAVNPNNPAQVAVANTDYVVLATSNGFEGADIYRDKPSGSESKGYDVIFDKSADQLILGVGDRDTNSPGGGEVYTKSATAIGDGCSTCWDNKALSDATDSNNGRVRAISVGYHDGIDQTSQTILAAVEGEGVFRYHNNEWIKSNGIAIQATKRSNFIWPDNTNSGIVYLLDLSTGLYRSVDGGANWTNIWPSMSFRNKDFFNTGYITASDSNRTILYLSVQGDIGSPIGTALKVYRMTGADQGIFGDPNGPNPDPSIIDITSSLSSTAVQRPGPITLGADGRLWLTQQQNSPNNITAALFVMENPEQDQAFADVTTEAYRNIAIQPAGIDVSADGHVYIAQNGTGLVKLKFSHCSKVVTNTSNNLAGSLIEAIECAEVGDTIIFDPIVHNQTIDFSAEHGVIDKDVFIIADPDDNITIDASTLAKAFVINAGHTVHLEGLNILAGTAYGIRNLGNLILKDCTVRSSSGIEISNDGELTIQGDTNSLKY